MELRHWDRHEKRLADSLAASGEGYTVSFVRDQIEAHRAAWHGFEECGIVTQIIARPVGNICVIWLVAGALAELPQYEGEIADWARSHGCVEIRYTGRRGFLKVFGLEEIGTIGRRKLSSGPAGGQTDDGQATGEEDQ